MNTIKIAVSDHLGRYITKHFFEQYPQFLDHLNPEDREAALDVEHDDHFEIWEAFERNFEVTDSDGMKWRVYTDGDIFFVREDHVWENE